MVMFHGYVSLPDGNHQQLDFNKKEAGDLTTKLLAAHEP
jgi:hypothetical protein